MNLDFHDRECVRNKILERIARQKSYYTQEVQVMVLKIQKL